MISRTLFPKSLVARWKVLRVIPLPVSHRASQCRSHATVSIGKRGGDKVDVVNFVGSDGLVDGSPELRECPALHFHLRKLDPATPRGLDGDVGLDQK
jgi:hypothetical protein